MAEQEVHELVVIKHRGGHGDEDHGSHGVWKIAYADFMTAMMAFFLVLWLLNSTNKEAKISIRNYFNPIKLSEASMTRKGIIDEKDAQPAAAPDTGKKEKDEEGGQKKGENGLFGPSNTPPEKPTEAKPEAKPQEAAKPAESAKPAEGAKPAEAAKPSEAGKPVEGAKAQPGGKPSEATKPSAPAGSASAPNYSEAQLFKDPFRALSDIVAQAPAEAPPAEKAPDRSSPPAGQGGEAAPAYQDPYESISPNPTPAPAATPQPRPSSAAAQPSSPELAPPISGSAKARAAKPESQGSEAQGAASATTQADAAKLKAELAKAVKSEVAGQPAPKIDVQATSEGVLISLTDEFDFGMFAVGSAQPQPKLIKIMERIAQLIKAKPGQIIIRGHTDGRAYKGFAYDNWRLSSDRAQMARYMLVRGGLDEKRFEAVEGYADRRLKVQADPAAAGNRRIEILLRGEKG
jgi:chemotaxis protein MotB